MFGTLSPHRPRAAPRNKPRHNLHRSFFLLHRSPHDWYHRWTTPERRGRRLRFWLPDTCPRCFPFMLPPTVAHLPLQNTLLYGRNKEARPKLGSAGRRCPLQPLEPISSVITATINTSHPATGISRLIPSTQRQLRRFPLARRRPVSLVDSEAVVELHGDLYLCSSVEHYTRVALVHNATNPCTSPWAPCHHRRKNLLDSSRLPTHSSTVLSSSTSNVDSTPSTITLFLDSHNVTTSISHRRSTNSLAATSQS